MAKCRQDPALDDLDGDLSLGFVLGLSHSGWHDSHVVMLGPFVVGRIDFRVVEIGSFDSAFRSQERRSLKRRRRIQPSLRARRSGRQILRGNRLGECVAACSEDADKDLGIELQVTRALVQDGNGPAGEVDEGLVAIDMDLAHRQIKFGPPFSVEFAESTVFVALFSAFLFVYQP